MLDEIKEEFFNKVVLYLPYYGKPWDMNADESDITIRYCMTSSRCVKKLKTTLWIM